MSAAALAAFGQLVVADPALQRELLAVGPGPGFVALVVLRAGEAGLGVGPDDVEEGLRARRRAWQVRWI